MKRIAVIILAVTVLLVSAAFADFVFPGSLERIEEEAFLNDASLTGLVAVPAGVTHIGKDAFSGTRLFALEIPECVREIGSQNLSGAAYIRFHGSSTALESLSGVCYLIGPDQGSARSWAESHGIDYVPVSGLEEYDGFYYRKGPDGLTLMSAADPERPGSTVRIPENINGETVTAISSYAFIGCPGIQRVGMPGELLRAWNQTGAAAYPDIEFFEESGSGEIMLSVRANVSSGTVGETITWTVETEQDIQIVQYYYSLTLDDEVIDEENTTAGSYSYAAQAPGSYQLNVTATAENGETGSVSSQVLYIAIESMKMMVPTVLQNGQDLTIKVLEVPGAYNYGIYLAEESTGKVLAYRTTKKPGDITFKGYILDSGVYRVSGYVYGNDFRYSVPTVMRVTVTGTRAEGPAVENQHPIYAQSEFEVPGSGAEEHAVFYQFRYGDGSLSEEYDRCEKRESIWIWPGEPEKFENGGAILIKRAVKENGAWTAWGPLAEIEILPAPRLAIPVVTAPDTGEAGKDLAISFESVENADWCYISLVKGYVTEENIDEGIGVFGNEYRSGRTVIIPGYDLNAGQYTLMAEAYSENGEYLNSRYFHHIEITGSRPGAPTVATDKTERYVSGGSVQISVHAPGAEGAYIRRIMYRNAYDQGYWGMVSISLDENGDGAYRDDESYSEDDAGSTMIYQVTTIQDGIWSEFASVEVLLLKQEPLPTPVIEAAEAHTAGMDYTFRFSPVEGADNYQVYFQQTYGYTDICSWYSDNARPNQDLTVPGYYLTQGSYRVIVNAYSEEKGSSEAEITVRINGARPSATTVSMDKDELHIKDRPVFTVDTTGAEQLMVFYGRNEEQLRHRDSRKISVTDNETTWRYTIDDYWLDCDLTFSFSVKRDGVWSAWKEITKTILNLPPLDSPVIHANSTYEAGEDISITFDTVTNAQSYSYRLYLDEGNTGGSCSEPRTISYSGTDYEPGTYRFRVTAESNDYSSSSSEVTFRITGNKAQWIQPAVSETEVTAGDTVTFEFETSNVDAIKYRLYHYEDNNAEQEWYGNGSINVLEDTTKWSTRLNRAGEVSCEFAALINGRWTAWTQEIRIIVNNSGEMELPEVEMPDTLPIGRDLTVTVGPAARAEQYNIYLYNSNGTNIASRYLYGNAGGTVTFDGYGLALGRNRVEMEIYTGSSWYTVQKYFTVVSNSERPQAPEVIQDTSVGRVNVRYGFTINTTGADKVAVRYYREDDTNRISYTSVNATGDLTQWYHTRDTAGTTWKYAFSVCAEGTWSPWSRTCSVSISDREQLGNTTIHTNDTLEAGRDLYISFDEVDNAESYELYLYKPDGNYSHWYDVSPGAERRIMGYDLIPGTYRIRVTASATDYESSTTEKTFRITGTRPSAPDVSVSSTEVFSGETFTFVIDSAGAEEITYRYTTLNGGGSSGTLNVLTDSTVWDTSASSDRAYSFSMLKDGKWSAWTTPIDIAVAVRPVLAVPEVTIPGTVIQGEDLTVTVGQVENATEYDISLYNNRDQRIASRYLSTAGNAVFSGYLLPTGSVRVQVTVYGSNNGSSRASRNLTVTTGIRPEAPEVTPPESLNVQAQSYYFFTVGTAGAEKAVVRYFRVGSPNDLYYSEFSASEGETTSWRTYQYNSGSQYAYSFSVQREGVWSEWSPFTVVNIE